MSLNNTSYAAILALMDIPVWRLKAPKLPLEIIKDCAHPTLLLIVGRQGSWEKISIEQQSSHLLMMERLVKALNRDFERCVLAEFKAELFPDRLMQSIAQAGIEHVIVFGKNLSYFLGVESTFNSKITSLQTPEGQAILLAIIPSLELLETNPIEKREAWGCLMPMKRLI